MEGRTPQWSSDDWHWEPYSLQAYPKHNSSSGFKEPSGKRQRIIQSQQPDLGLSGGIPGSYEIVQNYGRSRHDTTATMPLLQTHNNFRSSTSGCSGSADLSGMTNPTSPALQRAGGLQVAFRPSHQQQVFTSQGQMWTVQQTLGPPSFEQPQLQRTHNGRHGQPNLLQQQHQHVHVIQSNQPPQQQQLLLSQYSDLLMPKSDSQQDTRSMSFSQTRMHSDSKGRDDMPWLLMQSHSTPVTQGRSHHRQSANLNFSHSVPAPSYSNRQKQNSFSFTMPETQPAPPLGLLHIGSSLGATSTPLGVPMRPTQPIITGSMTLNNPAAPPASSQSLDPFFAALMEDDDDDPQVPSPGPASPSTHTTGTVGTLGETGQEVQMSRKMKDDANAGQRMPGNQDQVVDEQWREQRDDDICETSQAPERGDNLWQPIPEGTVRVLRSCELPHPNRMECQVPGCGKPLQGLRDYHQRYRICDVHIKLPQVMKDGWLQRFCQQCSRFHPVSAFDGPRRSCREQLSKHNLRRRRQRHAPQALDLVKDPILPPQHSTATPKASGTTALSCGGAGGSMGGMLPGHGSCSPRGPAQNSLAPAGSELLLADLTKPDLSKAEMSRLVTELREQPERLSSLAALVLAAGVSGGGAPGANSSDPPLLGYVSQHISLRMSFKLFKKTPADLPVDLRQQVCNWLGSAPVGIEGCIRPGCVHLTLQLLLEQQQAADLAASHTALLPALLQRVLSEPGGCPCWDEGMVAVQLFDQVAVVNDGQVVSSYSLSEAGRGAPVLSALSCLAVHVGDHAREVRLKGRGLSGPDCIAVVRSSGHVLASDPCSRAEVSCGDDEVSVTVPGVSGCQLAYVEVVQGEVMSEASPLLLVDSAELAEEVNGLARLNLPPRELHALLVDLGLVLQAASGVSPPYLTSSMAASKAQQLYHLARHLTLPRIASHLERVVDTDERIRRRSQACRAQKMLCCTAPGALAAQCC